MKYLLILLLLTLPLTIFPQIKKTVDSKPTTEITKSKLILQDYVMTSYCLNGTTASGEKVRAGIVAADLRIFPLGTKLNIEGYGNFIVKDTGSAVKGRHVDFWQKSCVNALRFGRKMVSVSKIA